MTDNELQVKTTKFPRLKSFLTESDKTRLGHFLTSLTVSAELLAIMVIVLDLLILSLRPVITSYAITALPAVTAYLMSALGAVTSVFGAVDPVMTRNYRRALYRLFLFANNVLVLLAISLMY